MPGKKIHPSLLPKEGDAYESFPQHGEPYSEDGYEPEDEVEDEADDGPDDPLEARLDEMNRRMGALQAENEHLRRSIPPVTEPQARTEPEAEEPDWEDLIFKDPKEAFRLHGEKIRKEVTTDLTTKYQREKNSTDFWQKFYRVNDDLFEDQDLVTATMNKHIAELSNMRSDDAMEKLADLTRERILRYSGKNSGDVPRSKKRSRAYTEGADAPRPKAPPSNVVPMSGSLTSTLKKRRAVRFKRGQVA